MKHKQITKEQAINRGMRVFAGPISLNPIPTQSKAHAVQHVIATANGIKVDSISFISEREITKSIIAGLTRSRRDWGMVENTIWAA